MVVQGALLIQKTCVDSTCTDEVLVDNPEVIPRVHTDES